MNPADWVRMNAVRVETGCLLWAGYRNHLGYGRTKVGRRNALTHRIIWEDANGPVPDGLEIDHICIRRHCVELDHLRLVDRRTNIVENNNRTLPMFCKRGHRFDAENTYVAPSSPNKRGCRACERERQARRYAAKRGG